MIWVIIAELLSGSRSFRTRTAETEKNGAGDTENGQMINGRKSSGAMNLGLRCFKMMVEFVYGDSRRRNMTSTALFQRLSMAVEE